MDSINRGFKGVWIPAEIWLNEDLSIQEKVLLTEIDSLDNENGCYAGNNHLAKFLGVSKNRTSKIISGLKDKGYIVIDFTYVIGTKEIEKRVIKIIDKTRHPIGENDNTPIGENDNTPIGENDNTPIGENDKDSNTYISNTYMSNTKDINTIVEFLNLRTDSKFKATNDKTIRLIKARFNEGYNINDFHTVIAKKTREWQNNKDMSQYLRPETLFGSKFEGYLNQPEKEVTIKEVASQFDFSNF